MIPAQYLRKSWMNRNRILVEHDKWAYIRVPIHKQSQKTSIREIKVNNDVNWIDEFANKLHFYRKYSEYYSEIYEFLMETLKSSTKNEYLAELNIEISIDILDYLGISLDFEVFSKMKCFHDIESKVTGPGDWALEITKFLGGNSYVNPPGGKGIFEVKNFINNGIDLNILENNLSSYYQSNRNFIPGLSIIDSLFLMERKVLLI